MFDDEEMFEDDLEGDPVGEVFEDDPECDPIGESVIIDSPDAIALCVESSEVLRGEDDASFGGDIGVEGAAVDDEEEAPDYCIASMDSVFEDGAASDFESGNIELRSSGEEWC